MTTPLDSDLVLDELEEDEDEALADALDELVGGDAVLSLLHPTATTSAIAIPMTPPLVMGDAG